MHSRAALEKYNAENLSKKNAYFFNISFVHLQLLGKEFTIYNIIIDNILLGKDRLQYMVYQVYESMNVCQVYMYVYLRMQCISFQSM
jgi:hypothetical protein